MSDVPVTLVPWFDAKDNPPEDDRPVWTNQGVLAFADSHSENTPARRYEAMWVRVLGGMPVREPPSVWCDPSPPDMSDPLTVKDLQRVAAIASFAIAVNGNRCGIHNADGWALIARLRRALDALDK